mmetsp:Transcript_4397/g.10200  ORF Transcript_4397/g.10200 Transcript_4397/m.10200 type:complete len:308 (+) Transcript_4397:57-980(+)
MFSPVQRISAVSTVAPKEPASPAYLRLPVPEANYEMARSSPPVPVVPGQVSKMSTMSSFTRSNNTTGRPREGKVAPAGKLKAPKQGAYPSGTMVDEVDEKGRTTDDSRWWTKSRQEQTCPLTNFPIRLLPYPPFKLRVDVTKPNPHVLIDGKFLALQLIANGHAGPGIRELEASDIAALDGYVQRCKLGPFRPSAAQALAEVMMNSPSWEERSRAAKELHKMRSKVRSELGKLRRIQANRIKQLHSEKMPLNHKDERRVLEAPAFEEATIQGILPHREGLVEELELGIANFLRLEKTGMAFTARVSL